MQIPVKDKKSEVPKPEGLEQQVARHQHDNDLPQWWQYDNAENSTRYDIVIFECHENWPGVGHGLNYRFVHVKGYGAYPFEIGDSWLSEDYIEEKLGIHGVTLNDVTMAMRYILRRAT